MTGNGFKELYKGPPISLWITGGGFSFLDMLKTPGCSKFLDSVVIPYSEGSIRAKMDEVGLWNGHKSSCSQEAIEDYVYYLWRNSPRYSSYCRCMAVSAALTTYRYRKGENRAFISMIDSNVYFKKENLVTYELTLDHTPESRYIDDNKHKDEIIDSIRMNEDRKISDLMMKILVGEYIEHPFPPERLDKLR